MVTLKRNKHVYEFQWIFAECLIYFDYFIDFFDTGRLDSEIVQFPLVFIFHHFLTFQILKSALVFYSLFFIPKLCFSPADIFMWETDGVIILPYTECFLEYVPI